MRSDGEQPDTESATPIGAFGWGLEAEMADVESETQFMREVIELAKSRSRKRLYRDNNETQERTKEHDATSSESQK